MNKVRFGVFSTGNSCRATAIGWRLTSVTMFFLAGAFNPLSSAFARAGDTVVSHLCPALSAPPEQIKAAVLREANRQINGFPSPAVHLHTEGTLPHQGIYDQSVAAKRDFSTMLLFALAWKTTGDERYVDRLDFYLRSWIATYKPNFNPIDETDFGTLIDAYVIVLPSLSESTNKLASKFLRQMAIGYVEEIQRNQRRGPAFANNWQSHRIKLLTKIAVALDDAQFFEVARRAFVTQLSDNLRADGSVEDFYERDALSYVTYNLRPLVAAAQAARAKGENWLALTGSNGSSLILALDWLSPYALGEKTHVEYVNTKVNFDKVRRDAGVPGHGQVLWDPKNGKDLFWEASVLESRYVTVARAIAARPPPLSAICHGAK